MLTNKMELKRKNPMITYGLKFSFQEGDPNENEKQEDNTQSGVIIFSFFVCN